MMTLARGGCFWPGCNIPTIRLVNGVPRLNLEIAHIRAFEEGGKRFDASWSVKERNSFDNLILLCNPHHEEVDGTGSDEYPVKVLVGWKFAREVDGLDALGLVGGPRRALRAVAADIYRASAHQLVVARPAS
ncbi:HNH endonuclease signature motif containing protein [Streptomyces sp. NPDC004647]|uniref:HNH endonuclease signature motif containing protein n=1 Tax=Streptomyces sp. NPDC004647 TaxID=3154671 RepID=UPI0033A7F754